jgi:hypothetical protein
LEGNDLSGAVKNSVACRVLGVEVEVALRFCGDAPEKKLGLGDRGKIIWISKESTLTSS